jgi:TP901 family phage tail tape measure protein
VASTDLIYHFLGIDAGAGASFDRMAAKTIGLGKASASTTGALTKLAGAAAAMVAAIDVHAIKAAADFQTELIRIHTQANASYAVLGKLRQGILSVSTAVATAPTQLAAAAFHIASVGQKSLTAAEQLRVLKVAAEGAKLGGADLVDVTNALDAAIVSHIRGVKNFSQAMGVLNATVGAGDMQMQDLAEAFGPLGAVLAGYNVNIRQAGAALATFGDNNLRGAEAGTQLRMAVQALAVPVKTGRDLLKSWGIHSGNLANQLRHGGLTSALDTLFNLLKKNGVTAREAGSFLTETFGKRAGIGLSVLIRELDRFHTKLGEVGKGGHNFASSWAGYTKTFEYSFDRMKAAVQKLSIQLGTRLMPTAIRFVNWLTDDFIPAAAKTVGWINDKMGPVFRALGHAIKWAFDQLAGTVKNNLDGFRTWGVVLEAVGKAVLYVAENVGKILIGVLRTCIAIVGELGKAMNALVVGFKKQEAAVRGFAATVLDVVHKVADLWLNLMSTIIHAAASAFGWLPGGIGGKLKDAAAKFDDFKASVDSKLSALASDVRGHGVAIGEGLGSSIFTGLSNAMNSFRDVFNPPINYKLDPGHPGYVPTKHHHHKDSTQLTLPGGAGIPISSSDSSSAASHAVAVLHVTAKRLAQALAKGLLKGWTGFALTVRESLSTGTQHLLEELGKQFAAITKRMDKLVEDARTKLHNSLKAERDFARQMMADANLSNVPTVDSGFTGQTTRLTNIGVFLSQQSHQYAAFARALRRLAHMGLAKGLINQIAGMGPTQGLQYAQQIISGQAGSVAQLNALQRQIKGSAQAIGMDRYGAQIRADRQNLRHQTHLQERIARRLDHLAADIGREVAARVDTGGKVKNHPAGLSPHDAKVLDRDLKKLNRLLGKK